MQESIKQQAVEIAETLSPDQIVELTTYLEFIGVGLALQPPEATYLAGGKTEAKPRGKGSEPTPLDGNDF